MAHNSIENTLNPISSLYFPDGIANAEAKSVLDCIRDTLHVINRLPECDLNRAIMVGVNVLQQADLDMVTSPDPDSRARHAASKVNFELNTNLGSIVPVNPNMIPEASSAA